MRLDAPSCDTLVYLMAVANIDNIVKTIIKSGRKKTTPCAFIERGTTDSLMKDLKELKALSINKVLLFGIPDKKDKQGSSAPKENNADYVAPLAMAKGEVAAMRKALDKNGYRETKIIGYSAETFFSRHPSLKPILFHLLILKRI